MPRAGTADRGACSSSGHVSLRSEGSNSGWSQSLVLLGSLEAGWTMYVTRLVRAAHSGGTKRRMRYAGRAWIINGLLTLSGFVVLASRALQSVQQRRPGTSSSSWR